MTLESNFIALLRPLAGDPAARGFVDDAAVLEFGGSRLVLTHDMIVEGIHFLKDDPPGDIAWKLVAVNLSDLAANGARPIGALLGYSLSGDEAWDHSFVDGLGAALASFNLPLLGGDTVSVPPDAPRCFGLTAIGGTMGPVPSRVGAKTGDLLWVSGTIGDAGAGLRIAKGELQGSAALVERYRRPVPRLGAGLALAPLVTAMMDVSDGLLLDASRLAKASGLGAVLELESVPLSEDYRNALGGDRLQAATAGDDYELLFAAPAEAEGAILDLSERLGLALTRIGTLEETPGLRLTEAGIAVPLPGSLGYQHGS